MVIANIRARARTGAIVLGVTASLGLAACGGDSDNEDYEAALNDFCGALLDKQQSLEAEVQEAAASAADDPAAATKALADVLREYSGTLTSELGTLNDTDAPGDYSEFDDGLSSGIEEVAKIANTTADQLEEVDLSGVKEGDTSGLQDLQQALTGLQQTENPLENLEAPAELEEAAPRCEELNGGGGNDAGGEGGGTETTE